MSKASKAPTSIRKIVRSRPGKSGSGSRAAIRRQLARVGLSSSAIAAAINIDPDAELLAACIAFDAADQAYYAPSVADLEQPELEDAWVAALRLAADLQPQTPAGAKIKARVIITAFERKIPVFIGDTVEDQATDHEYAAWRLLHDMLALLAAS